MLLRIIAKHPSHTSGTVGSSQDWKATTHLSSFDKDHWIFSTKENMKPYFYFSDWTEATDFCDKHVGCAILKALMDVSAFPNFYGKIVRFVVTQPQPLVEQIWIDSDDNISFKAEIHSWARNGFMMGNPVTKAILHGYHLAEEALVKELLLNDFGMNRKEEPPDKVQPLHLPRSVY